MTPRSGSSWLTEMARESGELGTPQEWLNYGFLNSEKQVLGCKSARMLNITDINTFVRSVVEDYRSPRRLIGIEMAMWNLEMMSGLLQSRADAVRSIKCFFSLRRRNILKQAISSYRSDFTGYYHSFQTDLNARERFDSLPYSAEAILNCVRILIENEKRMADTFFSCNIESKQIWYEDLVNDPAAVMSWMVKCISGEEIKVKDPKPGEMRRISDDTSRLWHDRMREEHGSTISELEVGRPG
ncbi:Stf0 family sulfotransferase [uncultured Enterovirga sp.]|uniref:Stf0 family sulfotransferase n=1 Tax=uncultured Enterovirga sp. TaxID=2026352 RepID=UPI0035CA17C2